ncbi:MAG: hypothetical protein NZ811_05570 [Gammaproteobacteria bacterium]|nr:hypothetical protein [Gammaproteobacteria bacterium]
MKTRKDIIPLLERLCEAVEKLSEDLRPEIRKTETMRRLRDERQGRKKEIESAVKNHNE